MFNSPPWAQKISAIVKISIAGMENHKEKQLGEQRVNVAYVFISLFISEVGQGQELKQGRNPEAGNCFRGQEGELLTSLLTLVHSALL